MAWNEPGNNNQKDPWGNGGKDQGPPDLDEVIKKGLDKLNKLFGGSGQKGKGPTGPDDNGNNNGNKAAIGGFVLMIVAVLIIALGFMSVYTVNQRERAVVLRFGKYLQTVGPGLQFKIPFIDQVDKVDVTKVRSATTKGHMLTEDDNIVEVNMTVQYVVSDPQAFTLQIRNPERTLDFATDSALRQEVGRNELHSVLTEGRSVLAIEVQKRLQDLLNFYHTGLLISKVNIEDTRAPAEVSDAFQDVQRAKEDEQRLKEEAETYKNKVVPEARGNAQRILEEASGYKARVVARAEGDASRFDKLLKAYEKAPEVTRERIYLDSIEKVLSASTKILIDVKGGNNIMYLPLDKMMGTSSRSSKTASSSENPKASSQSADGDTSAIVDKVLQEMRARQSVNSLRSSDAIRSGR
jgi:membrane protease subunit HflK